MYVIKMENDKSLVTTIKSTIYRGELNANRILFLLPNEWEEHLLADYGVRLDYITPDGIGNSEMLAFEHDSYKGYLQFYVPVDCPMTDQAGSVELWLSILDMDGTLVIKTGSNYLLVEERKVITDYYPAEKRELLATLATDVEALKKTKADNLIYDEDDSYLQLSAEGDPIGDKVYLSSDGPTPVDSIILDGGDADDEDEEVPVSDFILFGGNAE